MLTNKKRVHIKNIPKLVNKSYTYCMNSINELIFIGCCTQLLTCQTSTQNYVNKFIEPQRLLFYTLSRRLDAFFAIKAQEHALPAMSVRCCTRWRHAQHECTRGAHVVWPECVCTRKSPFMLC